MDINGNYIQSQFCSYEIALKLKELGFDEECFCTYHNAELSRNPSHKIDATPIQGKPYVWKNSKVHNSIVCVPLWQQVIDWFLVKYNIWINIDTSLIKFYKDEELQPSKFQFIIENLENRDADYMFHSADEELFYFDYKYAREQAILKIIELCQNKN